MTKENNNCEDDYIKNSNNQKTIKAYIEELVRKEDFLKTVKIIREKYSIPKNGFGKKYAKNFAYPSDWVAMEDKDLLDEYYKKMKELAKEYYIHFGDFNYSLGHYILYNHLPDSFELRGICRVTDLKALQDESVTKYNKDVVEENNNVYPIAIQISPYASQRDVIDYVKRRFKEDIEPMQERYKKEGVILGKVRTKDPFKQKRDDFIYENRHLSTWEIGEKLRKTFKERKNELHLEEWHINKIIEIQEKKRQ